MLNKSDKWSTNDLISKAAKNEWWWPYYTHCIVQYNVDEYEQHLEQTAKMLRKWLNFRDWHCWCMNVHNAHTNAVTISISQHCKHIKSNAQRRKNKKNIQLKFLSIQNQCQHTWCTRSLCGREKTVWKMWTRNSYVMCKIACDYIFIVA